MCESNRVKVQKQYMVSGERKGQNGALGREADKVKEDRRDEERMRTVTLCTKISWSQSMKWSRTGIKTASREVNKKH